VSSRKSAGESTSADQRWPAATSTAPASLAGSVLSAVHQPSRSASSSARTHLFWLLLLAHRALVIRRRRHSSRTKSMFAHRSSDRRARDCRRSQHATRSSYGTAVWESACTLLFWLLLLARCLIARCRSRADRAGKPPTSSSIADEEACCSLLLSTAARDPLVDSSG
jgi:hypothetical protein